MPHLKTSDDASLVLELDPSFTGILRGVAYSDSEGCSVRGKCILKVNKTIKVRRLWVWLEGRCKVTLKNAAYDGTESRTLYTKDIHFLGDDGSTTVLPPGQYVYPFVFYLSPNLPASFRGKKGYIRYRLQAAVYRPMFTSDIEVSRDIPIRRCLLNDQRMTNLHETYTGRHHTNKLSFKVNAPTISYREGGLIRLHISIQLTRPDTQSVKIVACALRERIQYRTTDGFGKTVLSKTENLFPLGYNTFYPSQSTDYDPKEELNCNVLFRLCPRVNADLNSRLMKINHALVINIMVEDTEDGDNESCYETDVNDLEWQSNDHLPQHGDTKQPHPEDTSSSFPQDTHETNSILSRSSSATSLTSLFSLGRHQENSIPSLPEIKTPRKQKNGHSPSSTLCSIEIPLVVTSREDAWNDKPAPPSYVDEPPSYHTALNTLPKAPNYDSSVC